MTMQTIQYNPWPLGKLDEKLRRQEPYIIKDMGYQWEDPRDIIDIFEKKVAKFANSNYAVAVDSCTHAIELCLRYLLKTKELKKGDYVIIPKNTYVSVYILLCNLGFNVKCSEYKWSGFYQIINSRIIDSAVRWNDNMYIKDSLQCLSFQIKKRIPIGRGGMILCNDEKEYQWLKLARYDGRDLSTPYDSSGHVKFLGYHYYMTPEDAARGIILMDEIKTTGDTGSWENYPDIENMIKNI